MTAQFSGTTSILKRDYIRVNPVPDAETVIALIGGWIEDYNENHPRSGLKWRSPREFIRAKTKTAQVSAETSARSRRPEPVHR